jgi:deoxyhypusine synthase
VVYDPDMADTREFHDGRTDGLVALESLDLDQVKSFAGLLRGMSRTAFSGRSLGEALDVTVAMVKDPDCKVVLTLSGAMTIAKMGKVISKMIDTGMVQAVVSTGALMAHGMSEAVGLTHYRHDPRMSDEELYDKGYNRVYDTLEMEANLNYVEEFTSKALDRLGGERELSSEIVNRTLGEVLAEDERATGVLRSAFLREVPVYVPAFTDSELGLDLSTWAMKAAQQKGVRDPNELLGVVPRYNPFRDLASFARFALGAKKLGIFTIGGGVPRNWAQEVGPYVDITNHRLGTEFTAPRYTYAVRICPEPVHWGGLSGCTYSEGVSWGKFVPPAEGGRFAEVYADATTVWPLLMKGVLEELGLS